MTLRPEVKSWLKDWQFLYTVALVFIACFAWAKGIERDMAVIQRDLKEIKAAATTDKQTKDQIDASQQTSIQELQSSIDKLTGTVTTLIDVMKFQREGK